MILSMGAILTWLSVTRGYEGEGVGGGCAPSHAKRETLGIIEYWMPISCYNKPNNNFNINNISMKRKNVGMTIAQKVRKEG